MAIEDYLIGDLRDTQKYISKLSRSGLSDFPPLIVTCAITGGNHGKEANPNLPETADEQVQAAYEAYNAGASMVHIHRRSSKNPAVMTDDPMEYLEVNARIREKCPDLIINNTAGGGKIRFPDGTISPMFDVCLDAKPEVASFDTSNFLYYMKWKKREPPLTGRDEDVMFEGAWGVTYTEARAFLAKLNELDIKPEYELFDVGDLMYLYEFIREGLVKGPHLVEMVMSSGFNFQTIEYLMQAIKYAPADSVMGCIAVGAAQFPLLAAAIALGCNVRVGMEDNVYIGRGELAKSNGQLVEKIVRIATELGRPIATPAQAREMLHLGEPREYTYPAK